GGSEGQGAEHHGRRRRHGQRPSTSQHGGGGSSRGRRRGARQTRRRAGAGDRYDHGPACLVSMSEESVLPEITVTVVHAGERVDRVVETGSKAWELFADEPTVI